MNIEAFSLKTINASARPQMNRICAFFIKGAAASPRINLHELLGFRLSDNHYRQLAKNQHSAFWA